MSIKSEAFALLQEHFERTGDELSAAHIAKKFDTTKSYAYEVISAWRKADDVEETPSGDAIPGDEISQDYREDNASITTKSITIKTLDDALASAKVDLEVWEPERHLVNTWTTAMKVTHKQLQAFRNDNVDFYEEITTSEKHGTTTRTKPIKKTEAETNSEHTETPVLVTNYQVKVWLKRRVPDKWEESIKALIQTMPTLTLPLIAPYARPDGNVAAEIALYDAHFGKFAWHPETMMGNWDIRICTDAYLNGCARGLDHAANYNPSRIYFVLGNDYMHVDNSFFKTPMGGHQLDADGRFPKIARKAMETIIKAIMMCREVAPVVIKWVPGNHDIHSSFWLSLILEQAFRTDQHVTVDNAPARRKAELWGNLLVGWWHEADGRKMPVSVNALAQWWPELWGQSKYRELHVGHKHKKVQTKTMPIETVGGVLIRQCPSLSAIDFWHQDNLFVDAVPASETLLWDKNDGVFANFTINVAPVVG